jgi:hypothetical protein
LEGQRCQVPAPQRFARRIAEDEVVLGHAVTVRQQALGRAGPVGAQHLDRRVGDLDRAPALRGLGLPEPPPSVHPHDGVMDADPARLPVDIAPTQREQLAVSHAGRDR